MNENAAIFKPDDITVTLGETVFRLVYDLNAFCELEKMYDSVDAVIQMVLGTTEDVNVDLLATQVKVGDAFIEADKVTVAGTPIMEYVKKVHVKQAKHADTLNLLWAGCLHDAAKYNEHGEIIGYNVSKQRLGANVTFKNLREVNSKIILALLRDLIPAKNAETPEQEVPAETTTEKKPMLTVHSAQ